MAPWAVAVAALVAANPPLDEARGLVKALRYEQALEPLRRATQVPTSTVAERRESFDLLVRTLAALGRLDEAEAAYEALLAADPAAPGPVGAPPRITAAFDRAKQKVYPGDWVRLAALAAAPGELRLAVRDPWGKVVRVVLSEEGREDLPLALSDGEARAQLSSPDARWSARAEDADGRALAQLAPGPERLLPPSR
ncbi:MAG: hypothetical protein K1X89_30665, partial [Myxococcaceae bacterium]|nr:hypothetical protein [Myxococcaceae bacterium]